jgi:quinol monooxygenase YgiN
MNKEICLVFTASVQAENWSAFEQLVAKVVEATALESGALSYQYSVNQDHSVVHIIERYRDSAAFIVHTEQTFSGFAPAFLALASLDGLTVHGHPDEQSRQILDQFSAVYMDVFAGFSH